MFGRTYFAYHMLETAALEDGRQEQRKFQKVAVTSLATELVAEFTSPHVTLSAYQGWLAVRPEPDLCVLPVAFCARLKELSDRHIGSSRADADARSCGLPSGLPRLQFEKLG
ncbi:hypothetical protein SFRURICE_020284 [Spodoptera frugiperda]|nr:hypothetical protein SFRURICE_020284 [Spodoptera frugiperda]